MRLAKECKVAIIEKTYDVVTTGECHIVHPDFCKILVCTKEYFEEKKVGFYKKMQHTGYLRHLLVRRAIKTGEILVDLITTTQTDTFEGTEEALLRGWTERLQALPMEGSFAGILHTKNDTLADAVKDEGTDILFGREHFYEELLGLRFQISPFSFFQTNSLGAEVLYEKTREYVGETKGKVVFDLYSGTGTIAQILAPVAKKVVGVEIIEEAVVAARENARLNGLDNCEFIAGDVLKVIDDIKDKPDSDIEYGGLGAYDAYREEEAAWLRETVASEEFRNASARIVLLHIPLGNGTWHGNIHLEELFLPILNDADIDVMLSGHTHRYSFHPANDKVRFPVLVNDNASLLKCDVGDGKITARIYGPEGTVTHSHEFPLK